MINYLNFKTFDTTNIRESLISISYKSVKDGYIAYDIDPNSDVYNNIINNFPKNKRKYLSKICVQHIRPSWNDYIHKDPRDIAINLLLDAGGDNVFTSFFDDDYTLNYKEKIPLYHWHWFNTKIFHCINNIATKRIAISISIKNSDDRFLNWLTSKNI